MKRTITDEQKTKKRLKELIYTYHPKFKGKLEMANVFRLMNHLHPLDYKDARRELDLLSELKYEAAKYHGHIRASLDQLTVGCLLYHLPPNIIEKFESKLSDYEMDRKRLVKKEKRTGKHTTKFKRKTRREESSVKSFKRRL